jgi:hypothetical protein
VGSGERACPRATLCGTVRTFCNVSARNSRILCLGIRRGLLQDYEQDLFWFRHVTWLLLFLLTLIQEFVEIRCALPR